jgi:transposase
VNRLRALRGPSLGVSSQIPARSCRHKRRNVIERLFRKLKNWRRVATRNDRLARNYLSGLALAALIIART